MPSVEDAKTFYLTHLPYRSWCPVCIKAKCKEDEHYRVKKRDKSNDGLAIILLDYKELHEDLEQPRKVIIGIDETKSAVVGHFVRC